MERKREGYTRRSKIRGYTGERPSSFGKILDRLMKVEGFTDLINRNLADLLSMVGTWTKPSLTVGPRTPFAKDNALDYSIDEGIEWEAEDPAEVELSSTLDEDEEAETEDEDEEDDWMVGDDEIEFEEGAEGYVDAQGVQKKEPHVVEDYYTEVGKAGAVSRNQRFNRLVPFQKGPCLEARLGEVDPVMDKYKICMLNGE